MHVQFVADAERMIKLVHDNLFLLSKFKRTFWVYSREMARPHLI